MHRYVMQSYFVTTALVFLTCNLSWAVPILPPKGVHVGAQVEGISEFTLANGLKVLLSPDASKATTTVNITYKVGPRHENYGETGMAHLLEHMLFKGTPKHKDIPAEMKKRGMSFNGTTWLDRTNYYENFSANPQYLKWALELEADRMVNSFVARKDLDSEMTVVRNEMESGENNAVGVLMQRMASTAYLWHNYGKSTIGARSDVENVSIPRLQAFYRQYYQPDNAVLLVAGRFDAKKTLSLINEIFAKIKKPTRALPKIYTVEPTQDGEREVVVRRTGDTQLAALAYHIPSSSHVDAASISVLGTVLGDTPSGRLHKNLVEKKMASWVSNIGFDTKDPGLLMYFAQVPLDVDATQTAALMIKEVETLNDTPVTAEEVERAKNSILKEYDVVLNDVNQLGLSLSESIASGDWRLFFIGRDRIAAVTPEDVNRVSAAYFKRTNRTQGFFFPDAQPSRVEIPAAPNIDKLVGEYRGGASIAAGEAFDPSPVNIEKRTERGQFAFGAKYALLVKKTRGQTVKGTISLNFGNESALQNKGIAAEIIGSMFLRGTTTMSREQINSTLDKLKATVSISGSATGVNVNILSTQENLPAVINLIADALRKSSFPESEFEQLRSQAITWLESNKNEPEAVADNELAIHFNKFGQSDPRFARSFDEQIAAYKSVTRAQALDFYRTFYGANNGEFAFVGEFDKVALKSQIDKLFSDWKSTQPYQRLANPYKPTAAALKSFETADKANAAIFMRSDFSMSQDSSDYLPMVVANYILGGGQLKSRLTDRIRKKDGLSYSVGTQFNARVLDDNATVFGYAIAAPENIGKVKSAFQEEVDAYVKNGVKEQEIKDAVAGLLESAQTSRSDDAALSNLLANQSYYGFTMQRVIDHEARLKTLDVATVNNAIKQYIKADSFSIFSAGDFAKKH